MIIRFKERINFQWKLIVMLKGSIANRNEPGHEKTCLMSYVNNKGAYQSAHQRSLISTFVVRWLDNIIPLISISEMSSL